MVEEEPIPQLQPEIWDHIIAFLRHTPGPHKQNDRKGDITPHLTRQPDLASMMAVSKNINEITAPHLYTEIITGNLSALVVQEVPIVNFCARTSAGPFMLKPRVWARAPDNEFEDFAIHFDTDCPEWPEIYGIPHRFILQEPHGETLYWTEISVLCHDMLESLVRRIYDEMYYLDLTIYASARLCQVADDDLILEWLPDGTAIDVDVEGGNDGQDMETEVVQMTEKLVLKHYGPHIPYHKLKWKTMSEAKPCGACGWKAPGV